MAKFHKYEGENGAVWELADPLPPLLQLQVEKGTLKRLPEDKPKAESKKDGKE